MNYQQFRPQGFSFLPPVVKNLLIINGLMFLASMAFEVRGIRLNSLLGLYYFGSERFEVYQFVTHIFMHSGFWHLGLNMLALWMFGFSLENIWGSKRFLQYYMLTGFGAAILQVVVVHFQVILLKSQIAPEMVEKIYSEGADIIARGMQYSDSLIASLNKLINLPMVGASGAVFGILLGYGMFFPNNLMYIYAIFPIKAKWLVIIVGGVELFRGIFDTGSYIAHFAHLGGMLFGFFLIKYWRRRGVI